MGHYYEGVVIIQASNPQRVRRVVCRALRALKHHPGVDRWSNILHWCKGTLKECRANMRAEESWVRRYRNLPFTFRCYGNYCQLEMWYLAEELARQSILHERSTPYPAKGPIFNEVIAITMGETDKVFNIVKYLATEDTEHWHQWETEAKALKYSPL